MASLTIICWREDAVGFTGWDAHASSELKKRLKRAIDASPSRLRQYVRQIQARELISIEGVKEEALASVRQILETQGAEVMARPGSPA